MKFGRVKAIFGVISLNSISVYASMSRVAGKRSLIVAHVEDKHLPDADILVFNGLKAFLDNATAIHSGMVAIVCAGPLQVSSLPKIRPLDYTTRLSYEMILVKPNYMAVIKSLKDSGSVPVKSLTLDHLSMIIDNTVTGGVVLEQMNSLFSMCNMHARNQVKRQIVRLVLGKTTVKGVLNAVDAISDSSIQGRADSFKKVLSGKDFGNLITSVQAVRSEKATLAKMSRVHGLESFEIAYFVKMSRDTIRIAKKKVT